MIWIIHSRVLPFWYVVIGAYSLKVFIFSWSDHYLCITLTWGHMVYSTPEISECLQHSPMLLMARFHLLWTKQSPIVGTDNFFIQSSVDGYLGPFQLLGTLLANKKHLNLIFFVCFVVNSSQILLDSPFIIYEREDRTGNFTLISIIFNSLQEQG